MTQAITMVAISKGQSSKDRAVRYSNLPSALYQNFYATKQVTIHQIPGQQCTKTVKSSYSNHQSTLYTHKNNVHHHYYPWNKFSLTH